MELSQLRYAVAVVDHGTFTAAAAACFVAQPSLSQAVRRLETELGVELFHRVGRRTVPTAAGEAFAPVAREALRAVDTIRAEVGAVTGLTAGHLDIVALPTLAVDPVAPLVGAFVEAHPSVTVRLAHPDSSTELWEQIRTGESEVGLCDLPVADDRLVTRRLGRQDIVAVLPAGARRRRRVRLAELSSQRFVTQPAGTSIRDLLDDALRTAGLRAAIAVETDQREAIVPLVAAGAGVAVVPAPMAATAPHHGAIVCALDPHLQRDIGLVHRAAPLSPAARAFVALAVAGAGSGRAPHRSKPPQRTRA
jgi:DNA-binding transcriptional LysR family regulator